MAARILAIDPVPEEWLQSSAIDTLKRLVEKARSLLNKLDEAEENLGRKFSDALVNQADEDMLGRYRTDHQGFLRLLSGAYRRDQRTLRLQMKTPSKLPLAASLHAVELAVTVKQHRKKWDEMKMDLQHALDTRFRERGDRLEFGARGSRCNAYCPSGMASGYRHSAKADPQQG